MRLIFALIYIASGIWVYLALGGKNLNLFIGIGVAFALLLSSDVLFNDGFIRRIRGQSYDDYVDQLIKNKKAGIESFDVHDAVTFEDLSTGCLCHLLNISINRIICLNGQYLYDYAEINDDPDSNRERSFPTTSFKLVRRLKNNELLRLEIGTKLLADKKVKNVNIKNLYKLGFKLEDGEIIENVEFRRILAACGI